jgi:glycosyltransferase involved in cell wall biosynthesis
MGSVTKQQANRPAPKDTKGLKVLQVVDSPHSAIRTLANQIVRHTRDKATIETVVFHPKRPDKAQLDQIQRLWLWCDIVDIQYWKSGSKIRELFPKLWDRRKKILTHYNSYNLHEEKWEDYEVVNVVNGFQQKELPQARMMPLAIDMDFFAFNRGNYTVDPVVNMSVSRIEGKKGVVEVAKACNELGYKLLLVGRVSDAKYIEQVKAAGGKSLEFRNNVSDSEVRKAYYESAIHVCNSVDNFESGTMPILEAMACGTPVLTRKVGHVPDIYNGSNMRLNEASCEDVESIKAHLKEMMDGRNYRIGIRNVARESISDRTDKKRAELYLNLYREVLKK